MRRIRSSCVPSGSGEAVLVGSLMVALGADRTELLVGAAGEDRELVAGSGSSADRALRLVLCHRYTLSHLPMMVSFSVVNSATLAATKR